MKTFDILVIGDGIAAKTLLWQLSLQAPGLKLGRIADEKNHPRCSDRSTGVVTLNGIEKGVSELGDKLFVSYHLAADFFQAQDPAGVEASLYHFIRDEKEALERRFGKAELSADNFRREVFTHTIPSFLIESEAYLNWFESRISCEHIDAGVVSVGKNEIQTSTGESIGFKKLVIAAGAWIKKESLEIVHDEIERSQVVAGTFATFPDVDWGDESQVFSYDNYNLIYRASDKKVLIGGTTTKSDSLEPDLAALRQQYDAYSNLLKKDLPDFDKAKIKVGLRHKGKKRNPYWGKLNGNVYAISGLYKNGWTLPFLATRELLSELI